MSRYDPLRRYLAGLPKDQTEVRLSFRDIERIVGSLPPSARNYRPWWGNSQAMSQAASWQQAGFVVDEVNLTAEQVVFVRGRAQRRAPGSPVTIRRASRSSLDGQPPAAAVVVDLDQSEAGVQGRLVAYLARNGWLVLRVADTATRERGIDVLARHGSRIWAIEVKGYPSRAYADPRRADQAKPTSPSVQARHWYAAALLKTVLTRDEHPDYQVAIALPDVATYRSLHERSRRSLDDLAVAVFFVAADGDVTLCPPGSG